MKRMTILAAAVLVAACAKPETAEQAQARMQFESTAAKAIISTNATAYAVHLNANHADSMAAFFTDDAVVMPPNSPAVSGKAAIRTWLTRNPMQAGSSITIQTADVVASGPVAVERGTYAFSMAAQGRNPAINSTGKYLNELRQVDGKWLIAAQIWSDDVPSPPMPPAPPPRN